MKNLLVIAILSLIIASLLCISIKASPLLELEIPITYQKVVAGGDLWFITKIANLTAFNVSEAALKYEILDSSGNLKVVKSETTAFLPQNSFIGNIRVPEQLDEGIYFLKSTLFSEGEEINGRTSFSVARGITENYVIIKNSLFDITVTIPKDYKKVEPGSELLASIKLINVGSQGRIDVFLDYQIVDSKGQEIVNKKETVAVETQANFVRFFDIPKEAKSGKYTLHAKIIYADGKEAVSNESFEVINKSDKVLYYASFILSAVLIIFLASYLAPKTKKAIERRKMELMIRSIVKKRLA